MYARHESTRTRPNTGFVPQRHGGRYVNGTHRWWA